MTRAETHPTYSLWTLDHESVYTVTAYKHKDTSSTAEVERWQAKSWYNVASFYRPENEVNAAYLQTFEEGGEE